MTNVPVHLCTAMALVVLGAMAAEAEEVRGHKGVDYSDPNVPGLIQVAAHLAVQKELGLSSETTVKLNALRESYLAAKQAAIDAANFPTTA